ncbi:MAG: hypothetical protein IJT21_05640 [Synergistaceae bacterium]|nr:hypothetical protein [Synergistaceae bacterium]
MKRKIFCSLMIIAFAVFAIISLGGCGGSPGVPSDVPDSNPDSPDSSSPRAIIIGSLTESRLSASKLAPYFNEILTEKLDLSDMDGAISVIDTLTSRDFLFFSSVKDNIPSAAGEEFYNSLAAAHKNGVIIVAVYPDSADIDIIETIINTEHDLAQPVDDAKDKHFELLSVALRTLPNGMPHTFVYVDDSSTNTGDLISFEESQASSYDIFVSPDVFSNDTGISGDRANDNPLGVTPLTSEQVEDSLHSSRVDNFFQWWTESIDTEINNAAADMKIAVDKFKIAASTAEEIEKLVTGVTTTKADNVSWSFIDYYNQFGKNNANFQKFADKCDFDNERLLNKYWSGFKISRETFSQYRAISFHSFEKHLDYYLVISRANTQPKSIVIAAAEGIKTRDEVPGAGAYNYAVILGYTKGLFTDIQRTYTFGSHIHYVPNQTVNKGKSYTDTNGWSITGGISFKGGADEKGPSGEGSASFTAGVSHTSSTTWQGQDYEVIPEPSGNWLARWCLNIDYPSFSSGWQISTAAQTSVTLDTESIWETTSRNFKVKGRAFWWEGFAWCHDSWILGYPSYMCALTHSGGWVNISLPRPPRIGVEKISDSGTKEGKLYSTKLYSDGNWTATTDSDWITLQAASGGAETGKDFYYTVAPNETGATRTGYITIDAGGYGHTQIEFVQSAY